MRTRNDTSAQIRARLQSGAAVQTLAQSTKELDRLSSDLRELDSRLKGFSQSRSSQERGEELYQKRGELIAAKAQLVRQLDELRIEIGELERREIELAGQETTLSEIVGKARKGQTLATIAARYREAVSRIKDAAAVQLRDQISQNVGELWTDIVERQREFSGLEFDNHWGCFLVRRGGERVAWDEVNTSAGQRQVRILAFYEALRRLARTVPPLVVDTPLGRLDKEVRANVLDKLYLSGHQSLILSTNSEIDPDSALFESIKGRLARVYTLHPDGEPDSTDYQVRVSSDYFGRTL